MLIEADLTMLTDDTLIAGVRRRVCLLRMPIIAGD